MNCCMNGFSRAELEVGMNGQGLSIARGEMSPKVVAGTFRSPG